MSENFFKRGWHEGARAWFWFGLRHDIYDHTGGDSVFHGMKHSLAPNFDRWLGEVAETLGYSEVTREARRYVRGALKAGSYEVGDQGTLMFEAPKDIPRSWVDRAKAWARRRVEDALRAAQDEPDAPPLFNQPEQHDL